MASRRRIHAFFCRRKYPNCMQNPCLHRKTMPFCSQGHAGTMHKQCVTRAPRPRLHLECLFREAQQCVHCTSQSVIAWNHSYLLITIWTFGRGLIRRSLWAIHDQRPTLPPTHSLPSPTFRCKQASPLRTRQGSKPGTFCGGVRLLSLPKGQ